MARGRFSSSGVVVGQTPASRWEKRLQHQKSNTVTMGINAPGSTEGAVGDITIRHVTNMGLRAYVKTDSGWHDINQMVSPERIEWIDMNLENSWVHDGDYLKPQYCRDSNGFIYFRGSIKNGSSAAAIITTLPEGFRPAKRVVVAGANLYVGQWNVGPCAFVIKDDGEVNIVTGGSTTSQNLDGVSYFAWQNISTSGGGRRQSPDPGSGGDVPT